MEQIQQEKYSSDSIKYGKDCADFIVELDACFYLNSRGEMITNIAIDSFLNQNLDCVKKIKYPDIVLNKNKVKSMEKCNHCGAQYYINILDFNFNNKLWILSFPYQKDSSNFSGYHLSYKGEKYLRNDDVIVH